ncbi:MAG: hypothetical protein QNJ46_30415, partial [Leptolyngbyaceae cyanobacterium MO_188.B28]|nr:hypothetical protein [Leptolyngbyaceae cyanobacterium MO_188.B28]
MGDQRINKSAAWNPQYSAWNPPSKGERSQLNPHPFVIQPKKHSNKRQSSAEEENQAFQRHQAEAQMLQLKEKYGVVTPLEQARLDVLQAKMQEFGAQRLAEIKAQPDLLDVLIRNPQMAQSPKPLVPGQAKLSIGCPTDLYEQEADHAASQVV